MECVTNTPNRRSITILTALVIQNLLYFMKLPPDTQQRLTPEPYLSFLLLTLATTAFAATAVILNRDKRTRLFCLTTICIGTAIWTVSRVTTPGELAFMVIPSLHVVGAGLAQVGGIRGSREKKGVTCNHTYYTYCSRLRGGRDDMEKQAEGEKGLMRFEEADG
jgi:hypothetical protein